MRVSYVPPSHSELFMKGAPGQPSKGGEETPPLDSTIKKITCSRISVDLVILVVSCSPSLFETA